MILSRWLRLRQERRLRLDLAINCNSLAPAKETSVCVSAEQEGADVPLPFFPFTTRDMIQFSSAGSEANACFVRQPLYLPTPQHPSRPLTSIASIPLFRENNASPPPPPPPRLACGMSPRNLPDSLFPYASVFALYPPHHHPHTDVWARPLFSARNVRHFSRPRSLFNRVCMMWGVKGVLCVFDKKKRPTPLDPHKKKNGKSWRASRQFPTTLPVGCVWLLTSDQGIMYVAQIRHVYSFPLPPFRACSTPCLLPPLLLLLTQIRCVLCAISAGNLLAVVIAWFSKNKRLF